MFDRDQFELSASTRNAGWSLRWENGELVYGWLPPPLEIFPTPGSTRAEHRTVLAVTPEQWHDFWAAVEAVRPWEWGGDYSWNERVRIMGGEHWKLTLSHDGRSMQCEGNNSPEAAPPGFAALLRAVVALVGPEARQPGQLLRYLEEKSQGVTATPPRQDPDAPAEEPGESGPTVAGRLLGLLAGPVAGAAVGAGVGWLAGYVPHFPVSPVLMALAGCVGAAIGAILDAATNHWLAGPKESLERNTAAGAAFFLALLAGVLGGIAGGGLDGGTGDLVRGGLMGLLYGLMAGFGVALAGSVAAPLLRPLGGPGRLLGLAAGATAALAFGASLAAGRDEARVWGFLGLAGGVGGILGGATAFFLRRSAPEAAPRSRLLLAVAVLITAGSAYALLARSALVTTFGQRGRAATTALSPDGMIAFAARESVGTTTNTDQEKGEVIDLGTGKPRQKLAGGYTVLNDVAFTPDGKQAVGAAQSHAVYLWSLDSGQVVREKKVVVDVRHFLDGRFVGEGKSDLPVTKVAILPGGKRALVVAGDNTDLEAHIAVWDLDTGDFLTQIHAHKDRVMALSVTPDGKKALTASKDKTMELWTIDPETRLLPLSSVKSITLAGEPIAAALTPDGKRAAVVFDAGGNRDFAIHVWDLENGQEVAPLTGHADAVTALVFLPDGRLVSGSKDQTVRFWNAATGREEGKWLIHGPVRSLSADAAGRRLLVAPETGALRLYAVPPG